jgi:hypothetical protein
MVHKKYIKRGDKTFGPYYYKNYREKGVTKTKYLGTKFKENFAKFKKTAKFSRKIPLKMNYNNDNLVNYSKFSKKNIFSKQTIIFLSFFFFFLGLILFIYLIYSSFNQDILETLDKLSFEIFSQKPFKVSINVTGSNRPVINISNEVLVCENSVLNHYFNVTDYDLDPVFYSIYPQIQGYITFYLQPTNSSKGDLFKQVLLLTDRKFVKDDVIIRRYNNSPYAIYPERIEANDFLFVSFANINITLIEVNNPPFIENIGVQTLWVKGENSVFDYFVYANDSEDRNPALLNFSIYFLNKPKLFNISSAGHMYLNATLLNESFLGVYDILVCVNDTGLKNPHENISLCWNNGFYSDVLYNCTTFSLTLTNENRAPNITSFYPKNNYINAYGTEFLYFNITKKDPDGTIPDSYWYIDNNLISYIKNQSFDEFSYIFGCGIAGNHNIKVIVTDGELNATLEWTVNVSNVACSEAGPDGGQGSGGAGGHVFCNESWICKEWEECQNLLKFKVNERISDLSYHLILERCNVLGYNSDNCGFQLRECLDLKKCNSNYSKPGIIQECFYSVNPNCHDNIKNCHNSGCESLTDCGGPCEPCPTCDDGIKNQAETGIDCGGPCNSCFEKPKENIIDYYFILDKSWIIVIIFIIILIIISIDQIRKRIYYQKVSSKMNLLKGLGKRNKSFLNILFIFSLTFLIISILFLAFFNVDLRISSSSDFKGLLPSNSLINSIVQKFLGTFIFRVINSVEINVNSTTLVLWDDTHNSEIRGRYTLCDSFCIQKNKYPEDWNVYFYANYSNESIPIDSNLGSCTIHFLDSSQNMIYNFSSKYWEYSRSFNYKGNRFYYVNCNSTIYSNLTLVNDAIITNTEPYISVFPSGYIRYILICQEDYPCYYDFSKNISEDDFNDILTYGYYDGGNTTITNFSFDFLSGILFVNITHSSFSGLNKKIELNVRDKESAEKSALLQIDVYETNDFPYFVNLNNLVFNSSQLFNISYYIYDEESNSPYFLNITFISCVNPSWSTRNSMNCQLFNESNYIFDSNSGNLNISFTPSDNDVGIYSINFTLKDTNSVLGDSVFSKVVNYTVLLINKAPIFRYVCDNERYSIEDNFFKCYINVSDVYEENYIIFDSNLSWFLNNKTSPCNSSLDFNSSLEIGFIPSDINVGNWTINISVKDTGSPLGINYSIINFYVQNINDSVTITRINNQTFYTNNDYTILLNATDSDLLIPSSFDPLVYKENLTFYISEISEKSIDFINLSFIGVNKTLGMSFAKISFSPNNSMVGDYLLNISVYDLNNYSSDWFIFNLSILGNNPPFWKSDVSTSFSFFEDEIVLINFSRNVSDPDFDSLTFGYQIISAFPSFNMTPNGLLNSVLGDLDVGFFIVNMSVSDNKNIVYKLFNFTVNNTQDPVIIKPPLELYNGSKDSFDNFIVQEDNITTIILNVNDDDLKILQKSFYNENINLSLVISGPNSTLFYFTKDPFYPQTGGNLIKFKSEFIPRNSDVGNYNISINVSDNSFFNDFLLFNLTVIDKKHNPLLINLTNYSFYIDYRFIIDLEAEDFEDINDSFGNLSYSYNFLDDGDSSFIDNITNTFNSSSGRINASINVSSKYHLNITVTDSGNSSSFEDFWIFIYDSPIINYPTEPCFYNLKENQSFLITINSTHFLKDNLSYSIYLNEKFKMNFSGYGNSSLLNYYFKPDFTDESYGKYNIFTITAFNPYYSILNKSVNCYANVTHTNAPVQFNGFIGDKTSVINTEIAVDLRDYFFDIDENDFFYNQTINYFVSSKNISYRISDGVLYLTSPAVVKENVSINASDSEFLATSNSFIVEFINSSQEEKPKVELVPQPYPVRVYVFLKMLYTSGFSYKNKSVIEVPVSIINRGNKDFSKVKLSSYAKKDNKFNSNVYTKLSLDFFETIKSNSYKNISLFLFFEENDTGNYDLYVNFSSQYPIYNDWAKIQIYLEKRNETEKYLEKIIFTEELIANNPECLELNEIVKRAKEYELKKDYENVVKLTELAINSCKETIARINVTKPVKTKDSFRFIVFFIISFSLFLIFGVIYYLFKLKSFKNKDYNLNNNYSVYISDKKI